MWTPIIVATGIAVFLGAFGGLMTPIGRWYHDLRKPALQPPRWLFGPAWTVILGLAAWSAVTAWTAARDPAARTTVIPNLPGYPARIAQSSDGGYWMCLFAMRTQLVELVLEDEDFRLEMMRTIEPKHWIAPQLATTDDFLDPLQGGGIRQLGIKKPWAPPRSYGLIAKLDPELDCRGTLHSRNGGTRHGVTGVREHAGRMYSVSKGHGLLLSAETAALRGGLR